VEEEDVSHDGDHRRARLPASSITLVVHVGLAARGGRAGWRGERRFFIVQHFQHNNNFLRYAKV
jgi:hypothetical protein